MRGKDKGAEKRIRIEKDQGMQDKISWNCSKGEVRKIPCEGRTAHG
jgi:hypothetical protein